MPKYFTVTTDGDTSITPFDRYHLAEVTGDPVKTRDEMPDDYVELTLEQAQALMDRWNRICQTKCLDYAYALSPDHE